MITFYRLFLHIVITPEGGEKWLYSVLMSVSFQSFKKVDSFRNQTVIVFTLNHNGTKHTNVELTFKSFVIIFRFWENTFFA